MDASSADTGLVGDNQLGPQDRARAIPVRWRWPPGTRAGDTAAGARVGQANLVQQTRNFGSNFIRRNNLGSRLFRENLAQC